MLIPILLSCCLAFSAGRAATIHANFPIDEEGRTYHLGVKKGEVANRLLFVGDPRRAEILASLLDVIDGVYQSDRGFLTYTGIKNKVPVTIMYIGIGMPVMDIAVREVRAITEGPLWMMRLGTCGTPRIDIPLGAVVVAKTSYRVTTRYGQEVFFEQSPPYAPDRDLHQCLKRELEKDNILPIVEAVDATSDSFYGSQGRIDPYFPDQNEAFLDNLLATYPETGSLQMETFQLFCLANLHNKKGLGEVMRVAACAIVVAQRNSDLFLPEADKRLIEKQAGEACLRALACAL